MEKLELDDFRISPPNQRIAEFHRLIKNGHFWGNRPQFSPVPHLQHGPFLGGPEYLSLIEQCPESY